MIDGVPLPPETGFLHQAIQHLRERGKFDVDLEIVSMAGFPADRVQKHLANEVLAHQPDVVVLQFGSTDAVTALRRGFGVRWFFKKDGRFNRGSPEEGPPQPPGPLDLIRWHLRSLASEILLVPPRTPLDNYLTAMLNMVDECRDAGSTVVVLSPFVMGGGRSNRLARRYTRALEQQLSRVPGAYFLDAHSLLSQERRSEMLLRDGFHLSPRAHQILGVALGQLLEEVLQRDCASLAKDSESGQPR